MQGILFTVPTSLRPTRALVLALALALAIAIAIAIARRLLFSFERNY